MNEARDDVSILDGKVIVWTVDVGWDDGSKVASVLFSICTVHGINETFCISVSFVGWMGWSIVEHSFIDGVGCLIRENTSGEHGNKFLHLVDAAQLHDVVIDEGVLSVEFNLLHECNKAMSAMGHWGNGARDRDFQGHSLRKMTFC